MELIEYKNKLYPKMQSLGHASQFAIPYALHFCKGRGYDIGCKKLEWSLPGSIPVDIVFDDPWEAYNLPDELVDYIFSSHCLEHLDNWLQALEYWTGKIKVGGCLFLYLPDYNQEYWRPWNNRKHKHVLTLEIVYDYMMHLGFENIFVGNRDLNDSFMIVGKKCSKI